MLNRKMFLAGTDLRCFCLTSRFQNLPTSRNGGVEKPRKVCVLCRTFELWKSQHHETHKFNTTAEYLPPFGPFNSSILRQETWYYRYLAHDCCSAPFVGGKHSSLYELNALVQASWLCISCLAFLDSAIDMCGVFVWRSLYGNSWACTSSLIPFSVMVRTFSELHLIHPCLPY